MRKKGFTLIELLAVIVILAVIAVIATPIVLNMIQTAKEGALKDSAYGYMSAIEYYVAQSHNDDEVLDYDLNGSVKTVSLASVKGTAPTGVNLKLSNGKVTSGSISYGDYAIIIVDGKVNDITKTKVTVTLVGDEVINHPAGTTFTDPGATAYDLIDEDITSLITVEGTVDINTIGTYTITYTVINSGGIAASKTRTVNITDSEKPVITITGDNPYTHIAGDTYTDLGASAEDNVDGDITSNIQTSSNVVYGIVGTYEVTYSVTDANGNTQTATRTVNVIDKTKPSVSFSPNGDSTYKKTNSTTVTISDNAELNQDSFKYLWSKNSTGIVEGDFSNQFTNGDTLSTPSGETGSYYLWILAKDSAANTTITKSLVFNLDNTAPTAGTMNMRIGSSTGSLYTNDTWTNQTIWIDEVNGEDSHSGHSSTTYSVSGVAAIATTTSSNTLKDEGTYTITVTTTDVAGNTSTRTYTVKIDKTVPTVSIDGGNTTWKNTSSTITITSGDTGGSTLLSTQYSENNTTWANYATALSYTTDTNITLYAKVTDVAGNSVTTTTTVKIDKTVPVITVTGSNPVVIKSGATYTDAGATALDNADGTLTSSIVKTGTVTNNSTGDYIITYTVTDSSGNTAIKTRTVSVIINTIEYLVVAGGGGGGGGNCNAGTGSAGGAGGLLYNSSYSIAIGNHAITVGGGGATNNNGGNSLLGSIATSIGGGRGGVADSYCSSGSSIANGATGGSGGSAMSYYGPAYSAGSGTSGQGNAGGYSPSYGTYNQYVTGGGGGAGGAGGSATGANSPGNGGVGLQYSITGTATYYAGGGGGGSMAGATGTPGAGAIGRGGSNGGAGANGVVIIAYKGIAAKATGGSISTTSRPGYVVHTFTSSGTFTVNSN